MRQYVDTDNKIWRAPLITLTQIASGDFGNNEPTECFVDPAEIVYCIRSMGAFNKVLNPDEKYPYLECTTVMLRHGHVQVIEQPREIALLREKAMGNLEALKSI